jgi:broad specificity phosphatase PhoE
LTFQSTLPIIAKEDIGVVSITYYVHGTTTDNEQGLATGWLPGKLSSLGKQQAEELGQLIVDKEYDAIFTSDLARAIETAHIAFNGHDILTDERLREVNYGKWTSQPEAFKKDMEAFITTPFPGGESYRQVEERMRDFCTFLKQTHDGRQIAIIGHQAPQLALDVILKHKSWPQAISEDWRKTKAYQPGWLYKIQ